MAYKKILGLDLGSKSMGIAISDGLQLTAQVRENFLYENNDLNKCLIKVKEYLEKEDIEAIVIGYPKYPSGDKSETTYLVEKFEKLLSDNIDIKIILIDEYYSTKEAKKYMINANVSRKKQKTKKDMLAAQIILQFYLDKQ